MLGVDGGYAVYADVLLDRYGFGGPFLKFALQKGPFLAPKVP